MYLRDSVPQVKPAAGVTRPCVVHSKHPSGGVGARERPSGCSAGFPTLRDSSGRAHLFQCVAKGSKQNTLVVAVVVVTMAGGGFPCISLSGSVIAFFVFS